MLNIHFSPILSNWLHFRYLDRKKFAPRFSESPPSLNCINFFCRHKSDCRLWREKNILGRFFFHKILFRAIVIAFIKYYVNCILIPGRKLSEVKRGFLISFFGRKRFRFFSPIPEKIRSSSRFEPNADGIKLFCDAIRKNIQTRTDAYWKLSCQQFSHFKSRLLGLYVSG